MAPLVTPADVGDWHADGISDHLSTALILIASCVPLRVFKLGERRLSPPQKSCYGSCTVRHVGASFMRQGRHGLPEEVGRAVERKIQRPSIPRARGEMVRNDGPEHEFDAFFRREYRRMVASVMRAGATVEDAEDAVSSAMALAAKRFKSLDNPTAWVRTVALRTHRRSANRDWERRDREESAPRTRSSQPDDYDFMRSVRTALKQLPRAQAVVLALAIDGYTTQEIASMLNANEDTVRSNLRHARAKIAAAIRGGDQNG